MLQFITGLMIGVSIGTAFAIEPCGDLIPSHDELALMERWGISPHNETRKVKTVIYPAAE